MPTYAAILRAFRTDLAPHGWIFAGTLVTAVVAAGLTLPRPYFVRLIVDEVAARGRVAMLVQVGDKRQGARGRRTASPAFNWPALASRNFPVDRSFM